jgi:host factor-I protein
MPTELDTRLPSFRQVSGLIKESREVLVKLLTNDEFRGKVHWQDPECFYIVDQNNHPTLIWRQAIAYIKPL